MRSRPVCRATPRRLYHLGSDEVSRSTLADANAQRPWQVFSGLFAHVGRAAHAWAQAQDRRSGAPDRFSSLRLSALSKDWARFSAGVCGAKVHIVYDPDADRPIYAAVTPANINDITAAKGMPIEAGATYVFDRTSTSFFQVAAKTWMAGHRRAEATPSYGRLCPAMTGNFQRPSAASTNRATLSAPASSPYPAITCTPTGNPASAM